MPVVVTEVPLQSSDNNVRYDAAWSVTGLTYQYFKSNINPQIIKGIYDAAEAAISSPALDYRLLRPDPATSIIVGQGNLGCFGQLGVYHGSKKHGGWSGIINRKCKWKR
jgi:hypothetical protein